MSDHKKRIDTLEVILAGSVINDDSEYTKIKSELKAVLKVKKMSDKNEYRLLQILHSTRALDSSLIAFINAHYARPDSHSLGGHLKQLANKDINGISKLSEDKRKHYQEKIVKPRNQYMHKAGKYPAMDKEVLALLSEMHSCLFDVFSL